MALYTRAQFAKECGVSTNYINTYIGRKKVIPSGDFIDDEVLQNKEFKRKLQEKLASSGPVTSKEKPVTTRNLEHKDPDLSKLNNTPERNRERNKENDYDDMFDLGQRKLKIEIEKREQEVEKLRIYNAKKAGELIPIDLVTQLVKVHNQSILTMQEITIESLLTIFSGDHKLTDAQTGDLRGKIKRLLNSGVEKAIQTTDKNLEKIVEEYSNARGIGDHD